MHLDLNNEEKILCLALSSEEIEKRSRDLRLLWNKIDEDDLFKKAKVDEVDSHVAWLMKISDIKLNRNWENSLTSVEERIKNLMIELENVAETFHDNKIKIVALKNAGIAKGIFKNLACSPMGDIDLLISSKDFQEAHILLITKLEYTFKFRSKLEEENLEEAFKNGGTEYYKNVQGNDIWLELQWRPVSGRWIQPQNEPNGDELIERAINIPGSKVMLLSPEDNLLQVSLHTAKHSYCRAPGFRLHSDVDRIVRFTDVNWQKFTANTVRLKVKTAVYFSLFFSSILLNTQIPGEVFLKLKPGPSRRKIILRFIQKAGIFDQRKKKFSKSGYIFFNILLYDDLIELVKAIIPNRDQIKSYYNIKSDFLLPFYYLKRLKDLLTKRETL